MNPIEKEQDIYSQLDGEQRKSIDAIVKSTELWNRLPKLAALAIAGFIVISFIF